MREKWLGKELKEAIDRGAPKQELKKIADRYLRETLMEIAGLQEESN